MLQTEGKNRKNLPLPKVILPIDVLAAKNKDVKEAKQVKRLQLLTDVMDTDNDLPLQYLDIGPETIKLYRYNFISSKDYYLEWTNGCL